MHDGEYLNCGKYVSDVFDTNTGIWWHCDDDNINQISGLLEEFLLERVRKITTKKESDVRLKICVICGLHHNKPCDKTQIYFPPKSII